MQLLRKEQWSNKVTRHFVHAKLWTDYIIISENHTKKNVGTESSKLFVKWAPGLTA